MKFLEQAIRPWGEYQKFFQNDGVWVKRLEVKPKSRLSLQKHQYRSEKWIIVEGHGFAVINEDNIPVSSGNVVDIPLGCIHRMCNPYDERLVFIEIASGNYLAEDDIIRISDDYSRSPVEEHIYT